MSELCRAWSAGVWGSAPPSEAQPGPWPCVGLFEVVPGILQASIMPGDVDGLPDTHKLHRPELVSLPISQLMIDGVSTGMEIEDTGEVHVSLPVGARLTRIGKPILSAIQGLNRQLGVRWLFETYINMDTGLIGRAAVYPDEHRLELACKGGTVVTAPIPDYQIVMAELRAGLAYTFDNPHPDGSCHD